MVPDLNSTQTWPRSQNPQKLLSDYRTRAQIQATLANLKHYTNQNNEAKVQELVEDLLGVLTNLDMNQSQAQLNRPIGVIREEPHFESMIICSKPELPRSRLNSIAYVDGIPPETKEVVEEEPFPQEPWWLRMIPHTLLFLFAAVYMAVGTQVFRWIDPDLGQKPYHMVLLLPYQICATVGWGNIPPVSPAGQLFCIVYAIFGVPTTFAALANLGRMVVEAYCADWVFLTAVVRKQARGVAEKKRRLPLMGAFQMLVVHQFFGVILYNGVLDDLGVVRGVYFNFLAVAMIGFGDIAPAPKNIFESVFIILYTTIGIVILSAMLVSISYHFQRFYFVILKGKLTDWYERRWVQQKLSNSTLSHADQDKSGKV